MSISELPSRPWKVGLIGLSAAGSWASAAHLPYLKSAAGQKLFTIGAVCNTSVQSALTSITTYGLDASEVKAYGDPVLLAADASIDLVVVCVAAPLHATVARPAIAARKRIFMEYPVASNPTDSAALLNEARKGGLEDKDLVCGLEEAWDAVAMRVKQLIFDEHVLGQVVHVSFDVAGAPLTGRVAQRYEYALQKKSGASVNLISHLLNVVTTTLGPLKISRALDLNLRPEVEIVDDEELRSPGKGKVLKKCIKEVADHTVIMGQFATPIPATSSTHERLQSPGASLVPTPALSGQVRADTLWPSEPKITWRIMGERGQIRITVPKGLAAEFDDNTTIEHFDYATGVVQLIPWRLHELDPADETECELAKLPGPARLIGRTYEAFARGQHVRDAGWEKAVQWQAWIGELLESGL